MYEWFERVGFTVNRPALAVNSPTWLRSDLSRAKTRIGVISMSKAVQFDSYGGIDVLQVRVALASSPSANRPRAANDSHHSSAT